MALNMTATVESIGLAASPNGQGVQIPVNILFAESTTGFSFSKVYNFPANVTQAQAQAQITADGEAIKAELAQVINLQSLVGAVIQL